MDTPTPKTSLPQVRTFAKDLERKRTEAKKPEISVAKAEPKIAAPVIVSEAELADREYRAPSWSGKKIVPKAPEKTTELAKAVTEIPNTLKPISAAKPAGDTTIVVDNEDAAAATIIRDTKKDRFKLIPAIYKSIRAWFGEQVERQVAKKVPKYTVPETSHRKGVIQKATSKTGKITSFDHTSIQERIRQREDKSVPQAPDQHLPSWSANTEPGYLLLDAPEPAISNIQIVPRKSFRTPTPSIVPKPAVITPPKAPIAVIKFSDQDAPAINRPIEKVAHALPKPTPALQAIVHPPVPVQPIPPTPTPTPTPIIIPKPVIKETPAPIPPTRAIPAQVYVSHTTPPQVQPVISETIYESPVTETAPTVVETRGATQLQQSSLREWLFTISTNTISLGVSGIVIALTLVGIIGYYWITTQVQTLELQTYPSHPAIVEAPLQLIYSESLQAPILFSLIKNNSEQSTYDVLQLGFIDSPAGTKLIEPQTILSSLNFRLDTAFMKAVSNLYFGSIKRETPFILLRVTDQKTAQGGMLGWEKAMYADLTTLLPNQGTVTDIATFTDITLNQRDLRVLDTKTGTELLVYGFVDRNTIIITTDQEAFTTLAALVK